MSKTKLQTGKWFFVWWVFSILIAIYLPGKEFSHYTKFVHSNLLFTETYKAFKIDVDKELERIMKTSPEYVIIERTNEKILRLMGNKYQLVKKLDKGKIKLYRLI